MLHLYVAGPMAGLPEHNFPAFHDAAARLRALGYEVTNPAEVSLVCGCSAGAHTWSEYLERDLATMLSSGVRGLALLPGWEASRGALLERHVAQTLGWPVLELAMWLEEAESLRAVYPPAPTVCVEG